MDEQRRLIGFMQSRKVSDAPEMIRSLIDTLDLHDRSWVAYVDDEDIPPDTLQSTAFIVTAGGDGTILRVNRLVSPYSIPIVGINMGRVGFMAELTVENAAERLPQYLSGRRSYGRTAHASGRGHGPIERGDQDRRPRAERGHRAGHSPATAWTSR